jgi:hypothetical protein
MMASIAWQGSGISGEGVCRSATGIPPSTPQAKWTSVFVSRTAWHVSRRASWSLGPSRSLWSDLGIPVSLHDDMRSFLRRICAQSAGVLLVGHKKGPGLGENSLHTSPCAYIPSEQVASFRSCRSFSRGARGTPTRHQFQDKMRVA